MPVFLDQTAVEDVRLTLAPSDWAALKANYLDNTYYPADFEWRGQKWAQVGIRSRGRGTRSAVKPALRIDFGRYASSQRFQTMKNLSIENLEQDPPMVREYLSRKTHDIDRWLDGMNRWRRKSGEPPASP